MNTNFPVKNETSTSISTVETPKASGVTLELGSCLNGISCPSSFKVLVEVGTSRKPTPCMKCFVLTTPPVYSWQGNRLFVTMRQLRQLQVKAFGINGSRFPPLVCTNRSKHLQVPARARVKENALISPRCGYSHLRISPRCLMSITYFKVRTKKSLISQHISFPEPLKTWLAPREVQLTIPVDGMILSKGRSRLKASTMNQTFRQ